MATSLYLQNLATGNYVVAPVDGSCGSVFLRRSSTNVLSGTGLISASLATVAGPTAGITKGDWNFISAPLTSGVTVSGVCSFSIWGFESNMAANAGPQVKLYRVKADGTTVLIINSEAGVELPVTTATTVSWTATPGAGVTIAAGERLMAVVFFNDGGGTMGSGQTANLDYNTSAGAAADGASWAGTNETITFDSLTAPTTVAHLYLTDDASPVTVAGENEKKLALTANASQVSSVTNTAAGPLGSALKATRSAGDSDKLAWYSDVLAADFTPTGQISFSLNGIRESNASANAFPVVTLGYSDADGTNPVVLQKGIPFTQGATLELQTSSAFNIVNDFIGSGLTFPAGKRIRFEVSYDDFTFADTSFTMASSFTCSFEFNDSNSAILLGNTPTFSTPLADNAAASDSLTRSTSPSTRSLSDSQAASDSLTRGVGKTAALADTAAATDALTQSPAARARTLADSQAAADTLAQNNVRARTLADAQAASDTLARSAGRSRTLADAQAGSDSLVRSSQALARVLSDNAAAADTLVASTVQRLTRTLADNAAAADSLVRTSLTQTRVLTDAAAALDTLSRALALSRTTSDSAAAADTLARSAPRARTLSDNAAAADTLTRTPTQQLFPDAILSATNLTGAVATVQDDPDSPDGVWMTATVATSDSVLYVSFPTPRVLLARGTNRQQFRIRIRRAP